MLTIMNLIKSFLLLPMKREHKLPQNKHGSRTQNEEDMGKEKDVHRIIEWFGLEGTFKDHLVQLPF